MRTDTKDKSRRANQDKIVLAFLSYRWGNAHCKHVYSEKLCSNKKVLNRSAFDIEHLTVVHSTTFDKKTRKKINCYVICFIDLASEEKFVPPATLD